MEDENTKVRRTVASGFHEVRREGGREGREGGRRGYREREGGRRGYREREGGKEGGRESNQDLPGSSACSMQNRRVKTWEI